MIVIFAGWTRSLGDSQILNQLGIEHRLLSYYELKNESDENLQRFVETGNWPTKKKEIPEDHKNKRYQTRRRLNLAERVASQEEEGA